MQFVRVGNAVCLIPPPPVDCNAASAETADKRDTNATPKTVVLEEEDEEADLMPWERDDFVPMTTTGKQKSPSAIRNEMQRYLDSSGRTQKDVLEEMGVSRPSFGKFMDPKYYKDPWSACQYATYWAVARFLAQHKYNEKQAKKEEKLSKKRAPAAADSSNATTNAAASAASVAKKPKTSRADADALMTQVNALSADDLDTERVFDSCPQVVAKIKAFLQRDGVSKASFCKLALKGANHNSLSRFLAGKHQDQSGNVVYSSAYAFFEKLRVMQSEPKSNARIINEIEHSQGFSTKSAGVNRPRWFIVAR